MSQANYYPCSGVTSEGLCVSSAMAIPELPIYNCNSPRAAFPFLMAPTQLSASSGVIYLGGETS